MDRCPVRWKANQADEGHGSQGRGEEAMVSGVRCHRKGH